MKKYSKRFLNTRLTHIEDILERIVPLQTESTTFEALKNAGQFDVRHLMGLFGLSLYDAKILIEAVEFFEELS